MKTGREFGERLWSFIPGDYFAYERQTIPFGRTIEGQLRFRGLTPRAELA